ncbi:MAG: VWA domain-containing protein [Nocardioidaceae bacterium]
MSFLEPARLWLLLVIPALVAVYVVLQHRKSKYAVRFTNMSLLDTVAPRRVSWRQHVAVLLALLTLAGGILLFAKPSDLVKVPRQTPVTVVLTMDISLSMEATDVSPNRITAAKQTAKEFLGNLPADYEVGVVSFSRHADVVVAPTIDRNKVSTAIDGLQLEPYTATGEGIYASLDVVKQSLGGAQSAPEDKKPAMVVLISDGKRTVGRSQVAAAEAAKEQGVPVYTVALGTAEGQIQTQGQTVPVPVEIEQLQQIADISGGKAYVASSPEDLLSAYKDVDGRLVYRLERTDVTSEYIGWLVLLSLISTGAGLFVASRWP